MARPDAYFQNIPGKVRNDFFSLLAEGFAAARKVKQRGQAIAIIKSHGLIPDVRAMVYCYVAAYGTPVK